MKNIFPHRFHCTDTYGWADSPRLSNMIWRRLRDSLAPHIRWYGTDFEILSPNSIKLFVYEIEDNFHGGIGRQVFETIVTEFTPEEETILQSMVINLYTKAAEDELERREKLQRDMQVISIRKEMFGV